MQFSTKTDIKATLNATFAALADFTSFERHAKRSGAQVSRMDDLTRPGPGMMWAIRAEFRGKLQKITAELVDYDPPNLMIFTASTDAFDAGILVELLPLSARETRMTVTLDLKPKSLAARLVLQSARLTKGSINKRFRKRLGKFGEDLESRIDSA